MAWGACGMAQAQGQLQLQLQVQGQGQGQGQPGNCEALRAQVQAQIASAGVARFSVTVVDAASSAPGRVVGSCDKGASKLLYVQQGGGRAAPPRRSDTPLLTECKDGSVTLGDCKPQR